MKKCNACHEIKELTDFYKYKKTADGLARTCKQCVDKASNKWRRKNINRHVLRKKERYAVTKALVEEYKNSRGCYVCGETDPCCIDMHHPDPSIKDTHPSDLMSLSYKRWEEEARKCVPLCSNCHRKVHANRLSLINLDIAQVG